MKFKPRLPETVWKRFQQKIGMFMFKNQNDGATLKYMARRFSLPSLHILHVRCKFCVIRAVGRNPQFLHV